jgi:hypothetical protein
MTTTLRKSERVGKLRAFRLSDIPDVIRMKHAMLASSRLVQHELKTKYGVPATPEEGWKVLSDSVDIVRRWVVAPSDRTYRVPEESWEAMLVEAARLEREAAKRAITDG